MRFFISLILFLFVPCAMAGSWGITGGISASNATNDNPPPFDGYLSRTALGFQLGAHYGHDFDFFRLRVAPQLRTLRARRRDDTHYINVYNLELNVPVLFEQMFFKQLGYFVGPSFSYGLRHTSTIDGDSYPLEFPKMVTSAMAGLTIRLGSKLYANVFYTQNLTDLAKDIKFQTVGIQFVTYFQKPKRR